MPKTTTKRKTTTRKLSGRKKPTTKTPPLSFLSRMSKKTMVLTSLFVFAVIGSVLVYMSNAATPDKFITKADVGPQASTYGHKPYGTLKKWTGGNTITESSGTRGADGWMRLQGYEFEGPLYIQAPKVALVDCKVTYTSQIAGTGTVVIKKTSGSPYLIDHCIIDQGLSGVSNAGVDAYYPGTVRYSLITGAGDGIKSGKDSLFEYNYINITGNKTGGHIDGIQGEYFKFNWIARNNTIIAGVELKQAQIDAGGQNGEEKAGNIGIYAPTTATGSAGPSGAEGVLVEGNYINGFNAGISVMGTNPNNPAMIRNNEIGPNLRYYPGLSIRIWSIGPGEQKADYVITQNNYGDRILNETTGVTSAYSGKVGKISDFPGAPGTVYDGDPTPPPVPGSSTTTPAPPTTPTPEPTPEPTPDPTSPSEPAGNQASLPATYSFDASATDWVGQGNATLSYTTTQGQKMAGALVVKADAAGQYPDKTKTIRVGTPQYSQGLTAAAGQNITASLAVKAASTQRNARCELRFYNGNKILSTVQGTNSTATTTWSTRTCNATAPAGTTNVGLRLFIDGAEYGESFYLDDATISATTTTTPDPTPPPTPPPTPDPTPTPTTDTQAPSTPVGLTRSLSANWGRFRYDLKLTWQPSSDNVGVQEYVITRNGQPLGTSPNPAYTDSTLKAGTVYTYNVFAKDAAGNTSGPAITTAKANCFWFICRLE